MINEKEDIQVILEKIKEGGELFYQQRIVEALAGYEEMLGMMLSIVDYLFTYHKENPEFPLDEEKIQEMFGEILSAMEEKDYTLMADIITYEFAEYVEEICAQM